MNPVPSPPPDLDDLLARVTPTHPDDRLLQLVELVLLGAVAELPAQALDGEVAQALSEQGEVVLEDAEGTPVALLRAPDGGGQASVTALRPFSSGPLRRHRRTPEQVRSALGLPAGRPAPEGSDRSARGALGVPVTDALTQSQVDAVAAADPGRPLLWLVLLGRSQTGALGPEALLRAVRDAAADVAQVRDGAGVVLPVALPEQDSALLAEVAAGFGAGRLLPLPPADGDWHPASARERDRVLLPPQRRGVTVFFTGLSGSGKSTVARALADRLLDDGRRALTLLDGDEVRRMLSAGLGFSRADRDLNIRRIGWVAARITAHGGLVVAAPIAPFAEVRAQVRAMVEAGGDFVLVHISTPLAECERRDRKGLYARARAGRLPEFTGISSPYEEPTDADLVIDTSTGSVDEAAGQVWDLLEGRGYLGGPDPRH